VTVVNTPMVVWVWIAVILMGIGGLAALVPHKRSTAVLRREDAEGSPAVNAAPVGSGSFAFAQDDTTERA
jgi:hypothetical protein